MWGGGGEGGGGRCKKQQLKRQDTSLRAGIYHGHTSSLGFRNQVCKNFNSRNSSNTNTTNNSSNSRNDSGYRTS